MIIVVAALFVAGGIATAGCSLGIEEPSSTPPDEFALVTPAPDPAGPPVLAPGDQAVITDWGRPATVTITNVRVSTQSADPQFGYPPRNGYYVTAYVHVTAASSFNGEFGTAWSDFYARHGSDRPDTGIGNTYTLPGNDRELPAVSLGAGENTSGTLVFDMAGPHGTIAYAPNHDGQALAYWSY